MNMFLLNSSLLGGSLSNSPSLSASCSDKTKKNPYILFCRLLATVVVVCLLYLSGPLADLSLPLPSIMLSCLICGLFWHCLLYEEHGAFCCFLLFLSSYASFVCWCQCLFLHSHTHTYRCYVAALRGEDTNHRTNAYLNCCNSALNFTMARKMWCDAIKNNNSEKKLHAKGVGLRKQKVKQNNIRVLSVEKAENNRKKETKQPKEVKPMIMGYYFFLWPGSLRFCWSLCVDFFGFLLLFLFVLDANELCWKEYQWKI